MKRLSRYKLDCTAEQAKDILAKAYQAEVIKRKREYIPDNHTQEKLKYISAWLTGDYKPGLLLYGSIGSGKTTMANCISELIYLIHDTGLSSNLIAIKRCKATELHKWAVDGPDKFKSFKEADMLFIDELGLEEQKAKSYGNQLSPIVDVLSYRYDRQLFTILTTNMDDKGIESFYGARIADRFREMFDKISYTNKSYR